jgi:hypothetical protein
MGDAGGGAVENEHIRENNMVHIVHNRAHTRQCGRKAKLRKSLRYPIYEQALRVTVALYSRRPEDAPPPSIPCKFSVQPASWASATNSSRKRDTISSGSGTQLASALTLQRIVSAYLMREALSMHSVVITGGLHRIRVPEELDGDASQVQSSAIQCNPVQSSAINVREECDGDANQVQSSAIQCNQRT